MRPLLPREGQLRIIAALLYFCALGTFGGLCAYYALDATVTTESVVAAEPRAGAEWNCSLIVTHTDANIVRFEQAWLDTTAAESSGGFTLRVGAAGYNAVGGLYGAGIISASVLEVDSFTSGGVAGGIFMPLLSEIFPKVSWQTAYQPSFEGCKSAVGASSSPVPTWGPWVDDGASTFHAVASLVDASKLEGFNLDIATTLGTVVKAQLYVRARADGGINDLNTPAVAAKMAAFAASPFMAKARAQYIEMICKPFAALKPYSCSRTKTQRRLPLVRDRTCSRASAAAAATAATAAAAPPPSTCLPATFTFQEVIALALGNAQLVFGGLMLVIRRVHASAARRCRAHSPPTTRLAPPARGLSANAHSNLPAPAPRRHRPSAVRCCTRPMRGGFGRSLLARRRATKRGRGGRRRRPTPKRRSREPAVGRRSGS